MDGIKAEEWVYWAGGQTGILTELFFSSEDTAQVRVWDFQRISLVSGDGMGEV